MSNADGEHDVGVIDVIDELKECCCTVCLEISVPKSTVMSPTRRHRTPVPDREVLATLTKVHSGPVQTPERLSATALSVRSLFHRRFACSQMCY
jgi:hypothetical protein